MLRLLPAAPAEEAVRPLFLCPVSASFPSPADDFIETQLDLNRHLVAHPASTFFLRASGQCMQRAGIFSGDILVVDTSLQARHNDIIIAVVDGDMTVKRMLLQGRQVILQPENDGYPPIPIRGDTEFSVWGVVRHVIHTF